MTRAKSIPGRGGSSTSDVQPAGHRSSSPSSAESASSLSSSLSASTRDEQRTGTVALTATTPHSKPSARSVSLKTRTQTNSRSSLLTRSDGTGSGRCSKPTRSASTEVILDVHSGRLDRHEMNAISKRWEVWGCLSASWTGASRSSELRARLAVRLTKLLRAGIPLKKIGANSYDDPRMNESMWQEWFDSIVGARKSRQQQTRQRMRRQAKRKRRGRHADK